MKTKFLSIISFVALALGFASCSDNWEPVTADSGNVSLSSIGVEVSTAENVVSRAEIDLNPYIVTIFNADNAVQSQWRFADMPEIFSLPVGKYTVEVKSHEVKKAAWNEPLYLGTKEFEIKKNEITEIGLITCKFASLKVTVKFSDALRQVMGNDVTVTVVANDEGELVFTPDTQDAGFFEVVESSTTLAATFAGTVNGFEEHIVKTYADVAPGMHYILNYGLRTNPLEPDPETGQIDPSEGIFVETGVTEINQDGTVNNDEDVMDGFGDHENEEFVEEVDTKYDAVAQTIKITAPAGLASVTVTVGADSNADFTSAFAALNNANLAGVNLSQFGLPAPSEVEGATSLTISLAKLIADAQEYEGTHTFTFLAADKAGAKGEPVTVTVKGKSAVEPITFSVPNPDSNAFQLNTVLNMVLNDGEGKLNGSSNYVAKVLITAPAKIKSLVLKIETTSDSFSEIADQMGILKGADLANPGDMKGAFDDLNLPTEDGVTQHEVVEFDIQTFVPLLTGFEGRHVFSIDVTDNNNEKRSTSIIFEVK